MKWKFWDWIFFSKKKREYISLLRTDIKTREDLILTLELNNDLEQLRTEHEALQISKQTLWTYEKRIKKWKGILLSLMVTTIPFLASQIPIRSVHFNASIQCQYIQIKLAEDYSILAGALIGDLQAQFVEKIQIGSRNIDSDRSELDLKANCLRMRLEKLYFSKGSSILISLSKDSVVTIANLGGQSDVVFSVSEQFSIEFGDFGERNRIRDSVSIPEEIRISAHQVSQIPMTIVFRLNDPIAMDGLDVQSVNFNEEVRQGEFGSGVSGGEMSIAENPGKKFTFEEGDILSLKEVSTRKGGININPDTINLHLSGSTESILGGLKGYELDFKPNFLIYLYYNEELIFILGLVILTCMLLLGMKNLLTK